MTETTSGDGGGGAGAARAARIGSARADFVSSLGRRVGELRALVNGLEQDPGSQRLRDDLRRRVHALSAGARLLRFAGMATALQETERTLERAASVGGLAKSELFDISAILDNLPSFALSEPADEQRPTERPPPTAPLGETALVPTTILVIGPSGLADAITNTIEQPAELEIECERADTVASGLELARALAPDVAVVDADLPGARDLVDKLVGDPLTVPTPLIVVGTWASLEEGARFVAAGASLALAKPVSPHDLRKACLELSSGAKEPAHHAPLGQTTVEQLTTLIIDEIKRGLADALVQGRSTPIHLGDGSDILAAVWGAVARVRDLVMIKSGGAVRFSNEGPEGALPIAPWWGEGSAQTRGTEAKGEAEPRLEGRKVVVADDDPAVTWFISGLLRGAGAEVREAHDGTRALELCFRLSPDLVISDVLMPGLDGFALCRALKRDIALRDVPVILLSWKEDLLQRLRDLGADADGYMRKEASAAAILQRVHEVLRTRVRIEARLKDGGEVRGRLDGVTPATLLQTTARVRGDARLCIRDASFLYEVEMRDGAPKSATRTTSEGSFQRGKDVFAALLGVRTGRFVVSRATGTARGTLEGDLATQLEYPIAHARAALGLLGGTRLLEVHGVRIALDRVLAYLGATPEPARTLVHKLARGASPRDLILGGEIAPAHLEEVVCDLAARGAVIGIQGAGDVDLLGPALNQELASIRRGDSPSRSPEQLPDPAALERHPEVQAQTAPGIPLARIRTRPGVGMDEMRVAAKSAESPGESPAREQNEAWPEGGTSERTPSSLEAAVIREISDGTPVPAPSKPEAAPSIVDTSELKARISGIRSPGSDPAGSISSFPPDAVVPSNASDDLIKTSELASTSAVVPASWSEDRIKTLEQMATSNAREPVPSSQVSSETAARSSHPSEPEPRRGGLLLGVVVALGALALLWYGLRYQRQSTPAEAQSVPSGAPAPAAHPAFSTGELEFAAASPVASLTPAASADTEDILAGQDSPLPADAAVAPGQGLLDIETGAREAILVDGVELGRGPFLRLTLTPGVHEVRLRNHGEERVRSVLVQSARRTRLPLSAVGPR